MSFNVKTRTILVGPQSQLWKDTGVRFLEELREDAAIPNVPERLRLDWKIVQRWLGAEGRELNDTDFEQFGAAHRSYLIRGVAPTISLEPIFKTWSEMAKAEARENITPVPPELIPVFDRLLASDQEILQTQLMRQMDAISKSVSQPEKPKGQYVSKPESSGQLNWIPVVTSIVMLLMAATADGLHDDWPSGFYELLRIVVSGTALHGLVQSVNRHQYWPWVMGAIAILFNPILPLSFDQDEWRPIDFGAAVTFVVALIQLRPRK